CFVLQRLTVINISRRYHKVEKLSLLIASKNLQKSSAIQNISVTLSLVIIAIFVFNCLYISSLGL
ncbi:hypothetical protein, partial [Prevotella pallens]|uniref:hypothetical protein n=1 Tax=Prevotella pallens TaxID=60133 RepID=UPI0023EF72EF